MRNVYLYGHLREKYGPEHQFEIASVAEAVRAFEANYPGFISDLRDGRYELVKGPDLNGDRLPEEMLTFHLGRDDLHIMPVVEGSGGDTGKGILTAVLGVAIVATAVFTAGASGAAMGSAIFAQGSTGAAIFGGMTYTQLAIMGGALALGGVFQALTPTPQASYDAGEQKKSFIFNGATNAMEQGGPVPVVYGKFEIGSTMVSGGMTVEDIVE